MLKFIIYISIFSFSVSSYAMNIKQMKKMKYWNKDIAKVQTQMTKKCGTTIPAKLNKSMAAPFLEANKSASGFCKAVLQGVMGTCESDEDVKKIVVSSIKKVECKYDAKNPKGLSFSMNGKTLVSTMGLNSSNIRMKTSDWLENNLGE